MGQEQVGNLSFLACKINAFELTC